MDGRSHIQFGLGSLLLLMSATALLFSLFGWLSSRWRSVPEERRIVENFDAFRPYVGYRGRNVVSLSFNNRWTKYKVCDNDLVLVGRLPKLEYLYLRGSNVSDTGLAYLKELSNLEVLVLDDTNVSDAGIVHLRELTNLVSVSLCCTNITAEGVQHLQEALPNVKIRWEAPLPTPSGENRRSH